MLKVAGQIFRVQDCYKRCFVCTQCFVRCTYVGVCRAHAYEISAMLCWHDSRASLLPLSCFELASQLALKASVATVGACVGGAPHTVG